MYSVYLYVRAYVRYYTKNFLNKKIYFLVVILKTFYIFASANKVVKATLKQ